MPHPLSASSALTFARLTGGQQHRWQMTGKLSRSAANQQQSSPECDEGEVGGGADILEVGAGTEGGGG